MKPQRHGRGLIRCAAALLALLLTLGGCTAGGISDTYVSIVFKALGVCLLTQLAADACRDAGETGLAAKAELTGKFALLTLALPLFRKVGELAQTLIGGAV